MRGASRETIPVARKGGRQGWSGGLGAGPEPDPRGVKTFEFHFEGLGGPGGFKERRDKLRFAFEEERSVC